MASTGANSGSIFQGGIGSITLLEELKFARDLLNYVLNEHHLNFNLSTLETKLEVQVLFTKNVGEAIMYQLLIHRNCFKGLRGAMFPLGFWSLSPLEFIIERMFLRRSRCFAEFIVFCTFLCHMSVFCVRTGNSHLVDDFVFIIAFVLGVKLKDSFETAGGWRVFMEFVERRNLMLSIAYAA